ncbi:MAG: DUF4230 domain-containing protein [Saprospiraceae bacterium]|nr:DUF4230 domain-containing protein [Saprospiraceae bacterium]
MKTTKNILFVVLALSILGITWYAGSKFSLVNNKKETSVTVVLEKIQKVFKLVTVEGHLSEIYNHKDYYNWDISFFRKTALVRVNAKVLAGYDFEKVKLTIDEESKTIRIDDFPDAEILSIEHDLDYYDITQGSFNTFSNKDYNEINKSVKEYALAKAIDSKLLLSAKEQKNDIMEMLTTIIQSTGWKVVTSNEKDPFLN